MVAIPAVDRHVHRFLWRNFETECELHAYVDCPHIWRPSSTNDGHHSKMAKLKQEVKPKAPEAIIDDTYVDDICDSIVNSYEAKMLTSDVDEVLVTGGFKVKWTSNVAWILKKVQKK